MKSLSKLSFVAAGLALAVSQVASAAEPNAKLWNGTWHLNAAKSKFASSAKEVSETRTYNISGKKVSMKSSSKNPAGKALNFSYTAGYDGKWYPMTGNPNADRISLKVVSDRELKASSQLHGKPAVESKAIVSADGKHLTIERKMLRLKDAPTDLLEFDR